MPPPPRRWLYTVRLVFAAVAWLVSLALAGGGIFKEGDRELVRGVASDAVERWHQRRATLPDDWENQLMEKWRQTQGGRHLQQEEVSKECKHNSVDNVEECCGRLNEEVTDACMSYDNFGYTDSTCRVWRLEVGIACKKFCGECNKVSQAVYAICRFTLQVLNDGNLIERYCKETEERFKIYRCPNNCHIPKGICYDNSSYSCMQECGNYMPCHCRPRMGTFQRDVCEGNPVNHGTEYAKIPNRTSENYTCDMTPITCMRHRPEGQKCAKHRYCSPNLCIINQVTCVPPYECADDGVCEPSEGKCFFDPRPVGYPCNDGISYTVRDQCVQGGDCVGTVDHCLYYNVTCKSMAPCVDDGVCHPPTGRCAYKYKPDGTYCEDGRKFTVEDRCRGGFCTGRAIDLCVETGVVCRSSGMCKAVGTCDPRSGTCSLPSPLSNMSCDDGDDTTVNDTCIDGLCIGVPMSVEFLTLGDGECTDRDGRKMSRYIGDTETEEECRQVCFDDAQCRAFNYAYPTCSLWGTIRLQAPTEERQWAFLGGSVPIPAVLIEKASPTKPGQRAGICRLKAEKGNVILGLGSGKVDVDSVFNTRVMVGFSLLLLMCFCGLPIRKCMRTCFFGLPQPKVEQEPSPTTEQGDDAQLRIAGFATDVVNDDDPMMPPASPQGGVSAVAALSDTHHNAASPNAASSISNESDGDAPIPLPPPPHAESGQPLPPEMPAPDLRQPLPPDVMAPELGQPLPPDVPAPELPAEQPAKARWERRVGGPHGEKPPPSAAAKAGHEPASAGMDPPESFNDFSAFIQPGGIA